MPFKKARIAIPSLIVLVAVAAGGAQLWAERQARLRVDETLAALPAGATGHYDSLRYNLFTQTLRLSGFTVQRAGQPQLAIRDLVLHHLSGDGSTQNPYHTGTVTLVGIDVWRGTHHVKIGTIAAKDMAILAPGEPVPAGTPRWLTAPEDGTPIAFGTVQADTISDDQGTSIVALSLSNYMSGQLRDMSFSHYADRRGNTIESAAAAAIDLDALDRVFNPARYTPDAPSWATPRPLLGHLEIANLVAKGERGVSQFDHLTIDGLTGRPFASAPTPETVKTEAFARDAAQAIGIGNATLLNLSVQDNHTTATVTTDDPAEAGGIVNPGVVGLQNAQTATTVTIGHMALTGYTDGALGRFTLGHVAVQENGKAAASLEHVELNGLVTTALLHAPPDASLDTLLATAQNGGVKLSGLNIAGLELSLPTGGTVQLKDLKDSVSYGSSVQTEMTMNGLSVPASATPELHELLQPLDIDPLVLSAAETGSYNPTTGDSHIASSTLAAQDLGSLSLSGDFTNLPHGLGADGDVMAALGQTKIGAFSVSFSNESLVQRIIAMLAKQSGKTPAEMTDGARAAAAFFAATLVPDQADAGQQIANFLANPKTVTLTAAPAAPVPVSAFTSSNLRAAQAALNLHLTAD